MIKKMPVLLAPLLVIAGLFLATPPASAGTCTTSANNGACGPYSDSNIAFSDGYNTYVANNMWACGGTPTPNKYCGAQTLKAASPRNWRVTSSQPKGNTAVLTYPDVQQQFTNTQDVDPLISSFRAIYSHFKEAMPHNAATDAEAGYDIWIDNGSRRVNEVMIWVDNVNRGTGGAPVVGSDTIYGQRFSVLGNGSEMIFWLRKNEQTGTAHILTALHWLQKRGYVGATARINQIDFGWEICSTGGKPEPFSVSYYTLGVKRAHVNPGSAQSPMWFRRPVGL